MCCITKSSPKIIKRNRRSFLFHTMYVFCCTILMLKCQDNLPFLKPQFFCSIRTERPFFRPDHAEAMAAAHSGAEGVFSGGPSAGSDSDRRWGGTSPSAERARREP